MKAKTDDLRSIEAKELHTAEEDARKQLAELRIDVYTSAATNIGKMRQLRKAIARIKTVQNEKARANRIG